MFKNEFINYRFQPRSQAPFLPIKLVAAAQQVFRGLFFASSIVFALLVSTTGSCAESAPVKIGFISILTGPYSDVGQAMANAARLAVEDYTVAHPLEKVDLLVEDDGADPKKALSAYLKLKESDKADLILPVSTFAIGALRDRVNRQKDLTFILGNEPYEPADDYIYMFSPAAIPAERGLGLQVAKDFPTGLILIVTSQNEAFFRFARAVQEGAGPRAQLLEIPSGADFAALALSIKARAPQALVFNGLPLETAKTIKELRRIGVAVPFYFDDSIGNSLTDFKTILGDLSALKNARTLHLTSHMDPDFVARYEKRFHTPAKIWTDYAYDAVALALKLKQTPVEEARAWLRSNSYQGVSGLIRFDAMGLRIAEFSVISLGEHPNFK